RVTARVCARSSLRVKGTAHRLSDSWRKKVRCQTPSGLRRSDFVAFAVGSKVVYPSHGVAQIVRREKRVVDGAKLDYLILEVPQQGWGTSGAMTVSVPEANAENLGVRPAISKADATEVLDLLAVRDVRVPANWSRRF